MKQWLLSILVASSLVASGVTLSYFPKAVAVLAASIFFGILVVAVRMVFFQ